MHSAGKTPRLTTTPLRPRAASPIAIPGATAVRFSPTFRVTTGSIPGRRGTPRRHVTGGARSGVVISGPRGRDSLRHPLLAAQGSRGGSTGAPPSSGGASGAGGANGSSGGGSGSGPAGKRTIPIHELRHQISQRKLIPEGDEQVAHYMERLSDLSVEKLELELAGIRETLSQPDEDAGREMLERAYRESITRIPPRQRTAEVEAIIGMMDDPDPWTQRTGVEFFMVASDEMGREILRRAIEPMPLAIEQVADFDKTFDPMTALLFHLDLLERTQATEGEWSVATMVVGNLTPSSSDTADSNIYFEAYKRAIGHYSMRSLAQEADNLVGGLIEICGDDELRTMHERSLTNNYIYIVISAMDDRTRTNEIKRLFKKMKAGRQLIRSHVGATMAFAALAPHLTIDQIREGRVVIMYDMPKDHSGWLTEIKSEIDRIIRNKENH